jgi:hypothetical protein
MKTSNPSPSISIFLAEEVSECHDHGISSYWKKDDTCLMQISSFVRESRAQVSATQRLSEQIMLQESWRPFDLPRKPKGCETAAATMVTDEGLWLVHAYFVWPSLAIHATVSRQGPLEGCEWAFDSLASIRTRDPNSAFFATL